MNLNYSLTEEDYVEFNAFHLGHSKTMRKSMFVQRYVISLVFLIVPFFLSKDSEIPFWYWFTVFAITYVLWIVFYHKYTLYFLKKRVYKMLAEGKNEQLLGERTLVLNEEGILSKSAATETRNSWNTVESVEVADHYVYIYVGAVAAHIVPKRVFTSDEQKKEFFNILQKYSGHLNN